MGKIYVIAPYWDKYCPGWSKPEAAFTERASADRYMAAHDIEGQVIELVLNAPADWRTDDVPAEVQLERVSP